MRVNSFMVTITVTAEVTVRLAVVVTVMVVGMVMVTVTVTLMTWVPRMVMLVRPEKGQHWYREVISKRAISSPSVIPSLVTPQVIY